MGISLNSLLYVFLEILTPFHCTKLEQSVNTLKDTLKNATNHALLQQLEEENKRLAEELQLLQTQLGGSNSSDDGQDLSNTEQWAVREHHQGALAV